MIDCETQSSEGRWPVERGRSLLRHNTPPSSSPASFPARWERSVDVTGGKCNTVTSHDNALQAVSLQDRRQIFTACNASEANRNGMQCFLSSHMTTDTVTIRTE